jgi:deazaflavin-dependent oxidoreductase (nitroreductase family)
MPPIVSAAGHIRSSAVRGERDIEAGAAVGAEAVAIRRLTLAGPGDAGYRRRPRGYYRSLMGFLDIADRVWPLTRNLMKGHTAVYRATNGIVGHRFPGAAPMLLLDHVGAKSKTKRTSPLVYFEDSPDYVIVASKGGYPKHPAWYHNLRANPDTTIQVGSKRKAVRARVASDEEHKRLWPKAVATYSGYKGYQERTDRKIPLVILEPRTR